MNLEPSEMFKALAVETRVKIIELLKSEGPMGAKKIAERVGITPAAVSHLIQDVCMFSTQRKTCRHNYRPGI